MALTRDGNREASLNPHSAAEVHHAETFNLSKINSVRLEHGHGPDLNGEVRFSFYQQAVDDGSTYTSSSGMFFGPPRDGYEYKVNAHGEGGRYFRPIIRKEPARHQAHHVYHEYNNSVSFVVDNYPRSSKDDNIHLVGIETSIPVPFGLGQHVLDQILAEIERGSTRDPIVIST